MTLPRRLLARTTAGLAAVGLVATTARAATAAPLLARYIELKNAHDASKCAELYTADYVEHSGRNPSGLPALIAN
jgi:hypothetical protein